MAKLSCMRSIKLNPSPQTCCQNKYKSSICWSRGLVRTKENYILMGTKMIYRRSLATTRVTRVANCYLGTSICWLRQCVFRGPCDRPRRARLCREMMIVRCCTCRPRATAWTVLVGASLRRQGLPPPLQWSSIKHRKSRTRPLRTTWWWIDQIGVARIAGSNKTNASITFTDRTWSSITRSTPNI